MTKVEKILFPTDFSELNQGALDYAIMLAQEFGASLHILHIVDQAYQYWMAMGPEAVPAGPTPEEMVRTTKKQMEQFVAERVPKNLKVKTEVISGRPFLEIIRIAKEQNSDLIVLGTHGRGALTQMLLGSVAEKVIRKSPCPVLSVRHPKHAFTMP